MEDPNRGILQLKPPPVEAFKERVRFIAKALAYGVQTDQWSARLQVVPLHKPTGPISPSGATPPEKLVGESWQSLGHPTYHERLHDYLITIWDRQQPQASFLEVYGYLERKSYNGREAEYLLTTKALALLDEPAFKKVFISYRREESSAFALLLCDRLRQAGFNPFLDLQGIPYGSDFDKIIEAEIENSDVFLCLISHNTVSGSKSVCTEITHALHHKKLAIPIWHNSYEYKEGTNPEFDAFLTRSNANIVEPENALGYGGAIDRLIQFLSSPKV